MRERKREKGSVAIKVYIFGSNNNIFANCILYCIYNYVGLLCFDSAPYTKKFIDSKNYCIISKQKHGILKQSIFNYITSIIKV